MFYDDDHLNGSENTNDYQHEDSNAPGTDADQTDAGGYSASETGAGNSADSPSEQETGGFNDQGGAPGSVPYTSGYPTAPGYGGNIQSKWSYDDYQKAMQLNQAKTKIPHKHKGLKAFVISVGSVLGVAVILLACFGAYNLTKNGGGLTSLINANSTAAQGTVKSSSGPSLTINSQPPASANTAKPLSGQMTVSQVAKTVRPTIVDVVTYSLSQIGETGEGSGIIMSADGYIITNNHVITGADKVKVVLANNKEYDATVVGSDARSDLAVLKIAATGLQYATFGNSDQLQVGDGVVAIGNPGGLEFAGTVTSGIVSALNRTVESESGYTMDYIQIDASINPGNSGGALVNMYGQVVGINAAKISDTDYEGMGFSIPINAAKPIVDSLIHYGYVKDRVKLGITVEEFGSDEAQMYNTPTGLLVQSVDTTSDAYAKGIRQGDIITKINSKAVTDFNDLYNEESKYKPGNTVKLTVYRYKTSQTMTFTVALEEDKGTPSTTSSTTTNNYSSNNGNGEYGDGGPDDTQNGDNGNGETQNGGNGTYYNLP